MTRAFWLDKGWYLALWATVFTAVLVTFVLTVRAHTDRLIRAQQEQADKIIDAINRRGQS